MMADRIAAFGAITLASIASHLADSLYRFVDEYPEAAREIRSVIATLFEIKTLLRELDMQFLDPRFSQLSRELLDDIVLGVGSCSSSLKDLDGIVLRARKSWNEILSSFRNIEGTSLQARLDAHRMFLFNLAGLLRNMFSPIQSKKSEQKAEVRRLQEQIRSLASQQEKVTARMREMEENHQRTLEEQAYQARYPGPSPMIPTHHSLHPIPLPIDSYRYSIPTTLHENRPMTPMSPISPISPITPLAPPMAGPRRYSVTPSPTMNRMTTPPTTPPMPRQKPRVGNPQLPSKAGPEHWWSQVFGMSPGSTSLSEPPKQSQCYGAQMDNLSMAPEEHEIFRVWSSGRRNGYRYQTAINASKLDIARVGPGIHLMRRNLVWACLYFADFETLTLFYHAFLALRYSAPSAPIPKESEYWLDGESLMFSAKIDDDGYTHALRLLKDRESGCIRLAAAKADGEQDVTVWTAFITNQICSSNWLYYSRPRTVKMKNIRQFSFSSSFETDLWRDFELRFLQPSDAHAFTQVINQEFRKMAAQRKPEYQTSPMSNPIRENYF
ncbi:hypothetical protein BDD12DRAFT_830974 [Trichophaea hybrida]|nr:hypothetical protein BDD12DRAFT_830974 [Trichophaea hybrida]